MVDNSDLNEALLAITAKPKQKSKASEVFILCLCYFLLGVLIGAAIAKGVL